MKKIIHNRICFYSLNIFSKLKNNWLISQSMITWFSSTCRLHSNLNQVFFNMFFNWCWFKEIYYYQKKINNNNKTFYCLMIHLPAYFVYRTFFTAYLLFWLRVFWMRKPTAKLFYDAFMWSSAGYWWEIILKK